MKFLKDLFMGVGNVNWDLGRILGAVGILMMLSAQAWNIALGLPLELGPTGLGGGLAAVLSGVAALIYAKDRVKAETTVAKAMGDRPSEIVLRTPPATPQRKAKR